MDTHPRGHDTIPGEDKFCKVDLEMNGQILVDSVCSVNTEQTEFCHIWSVTKLIFGLIFPETSGVGIRIRAVSGKKRD